MILFSPEAENCGRQAEVDLLRGFTAILLIVVHVGLYLGNHINEGLWTFCDITGSEPCAPVLMALMGISIIYSRHQRPSELLKRGIRLFLMGYVLNLIRSIFPLLILGNVDEWASVDGFFVVDILQFAGLSFMFIALLKKLGFSGIAIFAVSVIMAAVDQFIMLPKTVSWDSKLLTGIVNLFCPVTGWSCFPFLTWFCFPAFGMVYGNILKRCISKKKLYGILLPVSLCGTAYVYYQFYRLYPDYTVYYWGNNFYYMGLKNILLTLMIICFALSFWFYADKILPDIVKTWLTFLSVNLNTYYVISWIIISVIMHIQAVCGWKFGTRMTISVMLLLIIGCAWITKLWLSAKKSIQHGSLKQHEIKSE